LPRCSGLPTLDKLPEKNHRYAARLFPGNHREIDPASLYAQITALREAEAADA
jgi:hypothetical protein